MGGSGGMTASPFFSPPHLSPYQEGAKLTTRQNFLDEGSRPLPRSWYSQNWLFVSSNALSLLFSPLLWLLASWVSPGLMRDRFCSNVFHLSHHEKNDQKDDFVSMLNRSQKKQSFPTFHHPNWQSLMCSCLKFKLFELAFWIIFQLYNF